MLMYDIWWSIVLGMVLTLYAEEYIWFELLILLDQTSI